MSDAVPPDIASLSFEDALAELDAIVRRLEEGKGKLDEAVDAYERGSLLRKHCEAKLAQAQARIERIVTGADGGIALTPLDAPPPTLPPTLPMNAA